MKLGPPPSIPVGSKVWCRAASSYDQRKLLAWEHCPVRGWEARVQGRHVTILAEDVYTDRLKCHDSLVKDLEEKYDRHLHHCRTLRQRLAGLRNTRKEGWQRFIGKVDTGSIR